MTSLYYLEKSCELGNATFCNALGIEYVRWKDFSNNDKNHALKLFNEGCELGYDESCKNYKKLQKL